PATGRSYAFPVTNAIVGQTDQDELREQIVRLAVVRGRVVLSSGQTADWYVDLRRITLHHAAAPRVGRVLLALTAGWAYDAVREAGATVVGVATVVDRGGGAAVREAGLDCRAAYTLADLGLA